MDFLGNLCVCEGRAIPSTQSKYAIVETKQSLIIQSHCTSDTILNKLVYENGQVYCFILCCMG